MMAGIEIKIDEELLRDVHICAEERGLSVQEYITGLIERDLFPERFPEITGTQMAQLREAMEMVDQALGQVADILWGQPEQSVDGMSMGL